MTGTFVVDSPSSLLAVMRQVAAEFQHNYEEAQDQVSRAIGSRGADQVPSAIVAADQALKANALLVIGLPARLGPGLKLLNALERQNLYGWIGISESKLQEERPDGTFEATYSLQRLCRFEGTTDTFFDRVIQRLEAEEAPRILRQRHIEALHAIITAPGMNDVMAGRLVERFAEEGVTFEPGQGRLGLWEWQRPRAIEAALILIELGIPVTVDGRDISGAELLHALGFRARLDDQ